MNTVAQRSSTVQSAFVLPETQKFLESQVKKRKQIKLKEQKNSYIQGREEHDAEPIKKIEDILAISKYYIDSKKYRDNLLFITGINTGLRQSDLRRLRLCDVMNKDMTEKTDIAVGELKTNKVRHIAINDAIKKALRLYLENVDVGLGDFLFRSNSNNGSNINKPIERYSIQRILQSAVKHVGLGIRCGTHTMRKTFGYQFMKQNERNPRALHFLMDLFNHSSEAITLRYIGINKEEKQQAYLSLNLGG